MAWGAFLGVVGRMRFAGLGTVVGIETTPAIERLEASGVARAVAEELLAACEAGFMAALRERDADGGEN